MKFSGKSLVVAATAGAILSGSVLAAEVTEATSEKHAAAATQYRQAVFQLVRSNMGPLGGMAKGKVPFNANIVEKNATRIHQLSLMISDYTSTDTRSYKVKTKALPEVWTERKAFEKRIDDLTLASTKLVALSTSGDEAAILAAIKSVGKTCGGCHDNFKLKK